MTTILLWVHANHWWGGAVVFFFLALVLLFVLLKLWFFWGWWGHRMPWTYRDWPDTSPETVLKRRLAGGEISEADYEHLRDVLRRQ